MIVAVHTFAGGVAGEMIDNAPLAFLLGLVLHFLFDAIPHFDNTSNSKWDWKQIAFTTADFVLAFILIFFVAKQPLALSFIKTPFFWGAFGGFLPDLIDNVPFWSGPFRRSTFGKKFHKFHDGLHKKQPHWLIGLSIQAAVILIFLYIHLVIK